MTKEQQKRTLEIHFEQCYRYWKQECTDTTLAFAHSIIDIVRTCRNPFAPMGEKLDADVRKEILEKCLQEFCDNMREELDKRIEKNI